MSKILRGLSLILMLVLVLTACSPGGGAAQPTGTSSVPGTGAQATATTAPVTPSAAAPGATATTAATAAATTPAAATTGTAAVTPSAAVTPTTAAGTGTQTAVPTPTITPLAAKEGTLTIWADTNRVKVLTTLGQQFTSKYNVPVAVQEMPFGDIRDQLKIAGPAGEGPDIIIGANDWLGELVTNGLLAPVDLGSLASSFDPVAVKAFSYNGTQYGLPYGVEALALIYNKDLVPTPPKTWDELKTIAKQLQDQGKVDQGYVLQENDTYHFEPILTGFGGYIFGKNPDGSYNPKDLGVDSPGGLAAAAELDSMVKAGLLRKNITYDTMMSLFKSGKSAMMFGGPWTLPDLKSAKVNYGIAPLPTMKQQPRPFVGVQGFMISAFAKNKLLAQSFLTQYIATDAAMQAFYDAEPRAPAWLPVRNKINDPDLKAFAASAATGDPLPAIPEMSSVWDATNKAITLIFQQQQAPDQAFKDAATTIRNKISGK